VYAATAYSAGQVIEGAVRLAGTTDRFRVRKQLEDMRFTSLIGHYRVNREGKQVAKPDYVLQWQQQQRKLILPRELARYEVLFPYSAAAAGD
jgi:branched-chain amino acid transport system substrate-binding protein